MNVFMNVYKHCYCAIFFSYRWSHWHWRCWYWYTFLSEQQKYYLTHNTILKKYIILTQAEAAMALKIFTDFSSQLFCSEKFSWMFVSNFSIVESFDGCLSPTFLQFSPIFVLNFSIVESFDGCFPNFSAVDCPHLFCSEWLSPSSFAVWTKFWHWNKNLKYEMIILINDNNKW